MSVPVDWSVFERTVRAWVKGATGYADGAVIWANQDGPRPARPFATLAIQSIDGVGLPSLRAYTDLGRPAGQEIELRVENLHEVGVRVQFFTTGANSDAAARAVAQRVKNSLRLPTYRDPLNTAGISPFDEGTVRDLSAILESDFEGRAALDCRFYVVDGVSEYTTYIEHCEVETPI